MFSLDLPLFGLESSSKDQGFNLRIALFSWTLDLSSKVAIKKRDISGPITEPQGFCYQAGPVCPSNPEDDKSVKDPKCRHYLCSAAFLFWL
jgi:hypothetical protein